MPDVSAQPRKFTSCITDRPIFNKQADNLNAANYGNALCNFILMADTPITIGIQGGWGSGKTSLIKVLQEQLISDPQHPNLCVLVNAWEHSLFQNNENKAEVALSLMEGLAQGLQTAVENAPWVDQEARKDIINHGQKASKAIELIKCGLLFAGRVAAQMASNAMGTGDISSVKMTEQASPQVDIPKIAESVHKLRQNLVAMVNNLTYRFDDLKIVFFIDDLDRVAPSTAIEILDITKNIFDIPNCVFVLAIDYEVVVKGLETKFGKKDATNEREFRQYFDKIIQIPFTMPIGTYADHISGLLTPTLEKLGYNLEKAPPHLLKHLAEDAKLATGGIPRSIKRIINTLSLLYYIASAGSSDALHRGKNTNYKDLELQFIIVAIHINYPEIYRRLNEKPNFTDWKLSDLNLQWKLNMEENSQDLKYFEKDNKLKHLFDDDWEKVAYCLCSSSVWLKTQAPKVSKLLNRLLRILNDIESDPKSIPPEALPRLQNILSSMNIVSIENEETESKNDEDQKNDAISKGLRRIHLSLIRKFPDKGIPALTDDDYASTMWLSSGRQYSIKTTHHIDECKFIWDDNQIEVTLTCKTDIDEKYATPLVLEKCGGLPWKFSQSKFCLSGSLPFGESYFDDNTQLGKIFQLCVRLYGIMGELKMEFDKHLATHKDARRSVWYKRLLGSVCIAFLVI